MFTGLVEAVGTVSAVTPRGTGRVLRISHAWTDLALGESIACDGVCLTVETWDAGTFQVVAGEETLRCTTFSDVTRGRRVHLERALRVGDRLGGHLVSGHVDGVGTIRGLSPHDGWTRIDVGVPEGLRRYIAQKGSICIDGVSLTVNEIDAVGFSVGIIPHTLEVTRLGGLRPGDRVNLEVDLIARYVERLTAPGLADTLRAHGFME